VRRTFSARYDAGVIFARVLGDPQEEIACDFKEKLAIGHAIDHEGCKHLDWIEGDESTLSDSNTHIHSTRVQNPEEVGSV
jgi:hypothetical protein